MAGCFLSFGLVEPKADAADISPALFELGYIWSEADEAAFFKFGLEFWRTVGYDDVFAGADEVASEAFGALFEQNSDFIDRGRCNFFVRFFVKSLWAVCDCMIIDD